MEKVQVRVMCAKKGGYAPLQVVKKAGEGWRLDPRANLEGTSRRGELYYIGGYEVDAATLKKIFGKSNPTDPKSTYEYTFSNNRGEVASIYDYKNSEGQIGARNKKIAEQFLQWLESEYSGDGDVLK